MEYLSLNYEVLDAVKTYWVPPALAFILSNLILSNIFAIFDVIQPEWYKKREISSRPKLTLYDWAEVNFRNCANFLFAFIVGGVMWYIRLLYASSLTPKTPSIVKCIVSFAICYVWTEIWFWTSHYIAHKPFLYARVHKAHHRFPKPLAIANIYCSIWEMIIVNIPLSIVMPIFLRMHPALNVFWSIVLSSYIVYIHCGHYLLPLWMVDPKYHDDHHKTSVGNYGSYILDSLFLPKSQKAITYIKS